MQASSSRSPSTCGCAVRLSAQLSRGYVVHLLTGLSLAPGMDECHVLAAFEERACLAFDTPIEDGFTCKRSRESSLASGVLRASLKPRSCSAVEQEALHREFCALFEGFTGEFLDSRGVSEEAFGVALTAAMAERCDNNRSLLIVLSGRIQRLLSAQGGEDL